MALNNICNPLKIVCNLWYHRELIKQFTKRDVLGRYRGSYLGILWSFITPILMLTIFTFVFSEIFKARWGLGNGSKLEFALILFCGLIAFNLFAECIGRAPGLILGNANYVKKVVFPLEILPVVALGSALVHVVISLLILVAGLVVISGVINWTILFLPLVLLPLMLFILGLSWFLASIGVYLRDIGQVVGVFLQALMFLSPIFYPISVIPEQYRSLYEFNPISYVVEDMRRIIIWGQMPDWNWMITGLLLGSLTAIIGYAWFQKTRKGFADVL